MFYNCRVKEYPDGTKQYFLMEKPKQAGYTLAETEKPEAEPGSTVERKEKENMKRAIQKVYDYARSNDWDWFITLTFDPAKVDSFKYESCVEAVMRFVRKLRDNGNLWLLIPEQHESGRYHFHGLVMGHLNVEKWKGDIYHLTDYSDGFTTATKVRDTKRVSSYITKYLTKEIAVPKGKKRYWVARGLCKPEEQKVMMTKEQFDMIMDTARYKKETQSEWGRFVLLET